MFVIFARNVWRKKEMNKLYCRSCGYETTDKNEITDYCKACNSTMIIIVPISYRPTQGEES